MSYPPHALYEAREWKPSEMDRYAIETTARKGNRLRLLFDGGQYLKTGTGYGSFKVGENTPIRVEHDYRIRSSAVAEWVTLIDALRYLRANINPRKFSLNVSGDAQNVIYALEGRYHPSTPETIECLHIAKRYLNEYQIHAAYWIPRGLVVKHLGH